jgi:hypothetical protein
MRTYTTRVNRHRTDYTPRVIAFLLLFVLLLCAAARGQAQAVEQASSVAGVYTLMSVDGRSVPSTINHDGKGMNVHSGTFTVTTNGQVTSVMTVSVGDRKNLRVERTATYTLTNSELTMKWQNAGITKGRIVDQTFTMTNESVAYVYRKQGTPNPIKS